MVGVYRMLNRRAHSGAALVWTRNGIKYFCTKSASLLSGYETVSICLHAPQPGLEKSNSTGFSCTRAIERATSKSDSHLMASVISLILSTDQNFFSFEIRWNERCIPAEYVSSPHLSRRRVTFCFEFRAPFVVSLNIMERQFQCPSCGAGNVVTNPGVLMKICNYCKTAIYWDKESALRAGRKSMDLPPSPRFRVGATGKIKDRAFTVLGRLSYAHEQGTWNEWFVEMQDGTIQWLSEDEGEIFLETPLELTSPAPPFDKLEAGMTVTLNDRVGVIEELGEAKCLGGEGQIPFVAEIGETYPYADGSGEDGGFVFGLEYDAESGEPRAFVGSALLLKDAAVKAHMREEPAARAAEAIRCVSCGKPYEGRRVDTTKMVVCEACGSALSLDPAETVVVGRNEGKAPPFTLAIGTPVTLEKIPYEVMGRLYYVQREESKEYRSFEYVLFHPEKGYLWLSEEDGHFTASQPFHVNVRIPASPRPKEKVRVGQEVFQFYEEGSLTLRWVDGAIPWTAKVGEQTRYATIIKPPEYVDREVTGKERELFRGRYVSREEMEAAVPGAVRLPRTGGVYMCQPYVTPTWLKGMAFIGVLFFVLNLALLFYAMSQDKSAVVLREQITADEYTRERLSNPFEVKQPLTIMRLKGHAPVKNSWLSLDFGIVNAQDEVIDEFWNEASFYEGRDDEGYWSEGGRGFTSYFKMDTPGAYRLLVHGKGGSDLSGPSRNEPLSLTLEAGATMPYYFTLPIVLAVMVALLEALARQLFNFRRWRPVMPSSDDNGDDDD